jgi:two-component system, LytTR family, sensor kinase
MRFGKYDIKEVHVRWIGIFILAYLMTFVHPPDEGETMIQKYLVSLTYTGIYWNGAVFAFFYFRKRYPLIEDTAKRLTLTFLVIVFIVLLVDPVVCVLANKPLLDSIQIINIVQKAGISFSISILLGSIYENAFFFDQWKKTIEVNEALKNQQLRTQFEVLQNQMSPHFLFNSLNTLTTLIAEDTKIAISFTEKLSEVYRYILQTKDKEVVHIAEELEFVKNFVFLLQIRYPDNLSVNFDVPAEYRQHSIAPLTIQMLVENAIKHNTISKGMPLHISIYIDNGKSIVVKNNLQKKNTVEKSTKTGLDNIKRRYAYFDNRTIDVITTAANFMVAVPLLSVIGENTDHPNNVSANEGFDY